MRQTVICGQEDWEVLPFVSIIRDPDCASITVTIEEGAELWWVVQGIMMTVTWSIDPATSASSASTYTRSILLERQVYNPALDEWNLEFPWFELDHEFPDGISAPESGWYNAFFWSGTAEAEEDDVMNATTISAALSLFHGGYGAGAAPGDMTVAIKLRFTMQYDDGTEGTLYINSIPLDSPDPFGGTYQLETTATLLGGPFPVKAGDSAAGPGGPSTYHFGGSPPTIELTPALWFEYRRADGTDPIYDAATGTQLRDPTTSEE